MLVVWYTCILTQVSCLISYTWLSSRWSSLKLPFTNLFHFSLPFQPLLSWSHLPILTQFTLLSWNKINLSHGLIPSVPLFYMFILPRLHEMPPHPLKSTAVYKCKVHFPRKESAKKFYVHHVLSTSAFDSDLHTSSRVFLCR